VIYRGSGGQRSARLSIARAIRALAEWKPKARRRSAHQSVRALNADIRSWIETWNQNPRPYVWTKTAERILESIASYCKRNNPTQH
jgi:hypothetical protein